MPRLLESVVDRIRNVQGGSGPLVARTPGHHFESSAIISSSALQVAERSSPPAAALVASS